MNNLQKENEALRETLRRFTHQAYPEDVFLPVSKEELAAIHQMLMDKFNMPLDRLSGHIGREITGWIVKAAQDALK